MIINTASIVSRWCYSDFGPYCASKFVVVGLMQASTRAVAQDKIAVNGFAPGMSVAPLGGMLNNDLMSNGASSTPGEAIESFLSGTLLERPAQAEDIAGAAAFLTSVDSDHATGQIAAINVEMVLV